MVSLAIVDAIELESETGKITQIEAIEKLLRTIESCELRKKLAPSLPPISTPGPKALPALKPTKKTKFREKNERPKSNVDAQTNAFEAIILQLYDGSMLGKLTFDGSEKGLRSQKVLKRTCDVALSMLDKSPSSSLVAFTSMATVFAVLDCAGKHHDKDMVPVIIRKALNVCSNTSIVIEDQNLFRVVLDILEFCIDRRKYDRQLLDRGAISILVRLINAVMERGSDTVGKMVGPIVRSIHVMSNLLIDFNAYLQLAKDGVYQTLVGLTPYNKTFPALFNAQIMLMRNVAASLAETSKLEVLGMPLVYEGLYKQPSFDEDACGFLHNLTSRAPSVCHRILRQGGSAEGEASVVGTMSASVHRAVDTLFQKGETFSMADQTVVRFGFFSFQNILLGYNNYMNDSENDVAGVPRDDYKLGIVWSCATATLDKYMRWFMSGEESGIAAVEATAESISEPIHLLAQSLEAVVGCINEYIRYYGDLAEKDIFVLLVAFQLSDAVHKVLEASPRSSQGLLEYHGATAMNGMEGILHILQLKRGKISAAERPLADSLNKMIDNFSPSMVQNLMPHGSPPSEAVQGIEALSVRLMETSLEVLGPLNGNAVSFPDYDSLRDPESGMLRSLETKMEDGDDDHVGTTRRGRGCLIV